LLNNPAVPAWAIVVGVILADTFGVGFVELAAAHQNRPKPELVKLVGRILCLFHVKGGVGFGVR